MLRFPPSPSVRTFIVREAIDMRRPVAPKNTRASSAPGAALRSGHMTRQLCAAAFQAAVRPARFVPRLAWAAATGPLARAVASSVCVA